MLSYRHGFHAGNFADLLKHFTLALCIDYLKQKPAPVRYIDTHAGAGQYNIKSPMAAKTGEFRSGAGALDWAALPAQAQSLREVVQSCLDTGHYPGSPLIAARLLRNRDELRLFELHTTEYPLLQKLFARDRRVRVFTDDGFAAMKSQLPVKSARALVLLDPSYERREDYSDLVSAVTEGLKRMSNALLIIWYPIVDSRATERMLKQITRLTPEPLLAEFELNQPGPGMRACGVAVLNPPWTLAADLTAVLTPIAGQLDGKLRLTA
ncbi:MAG: hypothetical protein RLZZ385_2144 [Pseudomonadota bacterium]|jgi:23S rRNA (adenine2030-N6)-methyltransferase